MFNKLKQFKELRDQAKQIQNALAQEFASAEKNGIKITMNGNLEVTAVEITEDLTREKMAESFKICANDCIKKVQRLMATKMQQMGGLPGVGE